MPRYPNCANCGKYAEWHAGHPANTGGYTSYCRKYRPIETDADMLTAYGDEDGTRHGDCLICPHCGYSHGDMWEVASNECEWECSGCGQKFSYEREIEVTYVGRKLEGE